MIDEDVRLNVYQRLATTGRAPDLDQTAADVGCSRSEARQALHRLAQAHHLVLDDDQVVLAHPFATLSVGFAVMGRHTLWWGGCAWDSFAIPQLVPDEPEVLVSTQCPGCAAPHAWVVNRREPPPGRQVAHFLVPVARMWDDVVHTCGHQRLFCDVGCVEAWLSYSGNTKGYVMDLATLWRLAEHWYDGRLDRGYARREPAAAVGYFRGVGLTGPFWEV